MSCFGFEDRLTLFYKFLPSLFFIIYKICFYNCNVGNISMVGFQNASNGRCFYLKCPLCSPAQLHPFSDIN